MTIVYVCPQCHRTNRDPMVSFCPRCGHPFERRVAENVKRTATGLAK